MTFVTVQTFNRPGWPPNSPIELSDGAASAILTAARDYQAETGRDLHGDYLAAPTGGLRTPDEVTEMQTGFDLHKQGAAGWQAIYSKYNMDPASKARPSMGTHTTGNCADISDAGFRAWLKSNGRAAKYGLVFTLSPPLSTLNDLDHCQFFPGTQTVALDVTGLDNAAPIYGDDDMPKLIHITTNPVKPSPIDGVTTSSIFEVDLYGFTALAVLSEANARALVCGPFIDVTAEEAIVILQAAQARRTRDHIDTAPAGGGSTDLSGVTKQLSAIEGSIAQLPTLAQITGGVVKAEGAALSNG